MLWVRLQGAGSSAGGVERGRAERCGWGFEGWGLVVWERFKRVELQDVDGILRGMVEVL